MKKTNKFKDIKISKELRDILHGYIMSDGYIRDGVLTVDQSKKQKLFVMWLYTKFHPIRNCSPIKEVIRIQPNNQKLYGVTPTRVTPTRGTPTYSLRFFTKAILKGFQNMWYEPIINNKGLIKYRKKLPQSIDCFLMQDLFPFGMLETVLKY